jgi:Xaa-Pro aminopeptidase
MRYQRIDPKLFTENRKRLADKMAPSSLAVVNANDLMPKNSDALSLMVPQTDLFWLTGIEQEETILVICPDAFDEKLREVLFVRETSALLKIWEGHKHSPAEASAISGITNVQLLSEFPAIFHRLMCEVETVYLNSIEHPRATVVVEIRDRRFIADCQRRYPLHRYERLGRLLFRLRGVKSKREIELLRKAADISGKGFARVAKALKPGVMEYELEAEYAHEFLRHGGHFAYSPIIASGPDSCVLHYVDNDKPCKAGGVLLVDVAASYANYNADVTRTLPVSGKFTKRQRKVYDAVLRVQRASIKGATVGKLHRDWQREAQRMMNDELLSLKLITKDDIKNQTDDRPACWKYFPHGLGHSLGLDVHDYGWTQEPFKEGWVITVEPGIYIPKEGFGVRLENNIVIRKGGNDDLCKDIPIDAEEVEDLMHR